VSRSPSDECGQKVPLELPAVADEVVVHEEDPAAPPGVVERVEFGEHLGGRLETGTVAEEGRDVAELAVERAAPRVLDARRGVPPQVGEFPQGRGRVAEVGELIGRVEPLRPAAGQVGEEPGQGHLGLVEHEMVHLRERLVLGREERAAGDHLHARLLAAGDDAPGGLTLDDHRADEGVVGPGQVAVPKFRDVEIGQPLAPFFGQHGRDREESERRQRGALVDKLQRVLETPESVGEFGRYQENIHASSLPSAAPCGAEKGRRRPPFGWRRPGGSACSGSVSRVSPRWRRGGLSGPAPHRTRPIHPRRGS